MLTLLLLIATTLAQSGVPEPWDPCVEQECSPAMKAIASAMLAGGGAPRTEKALVASGECYHRSWNHDPNRRQYAVLLIDPKDGSHFMGGSFGFFYQENPYTNWTAEQLREQNPRLYQDNHRLHFGSDFAYAEMSNSPNRETIYWLRLRDDTLYVLGYWGYGHTLVCSLKAHAQ